MPEKPSQSLSLGTALPLLFLYYIITTALFIEGYWYTFRINAFQYIQAKEFLIYAPLGYLETLLDSLSLSILFIISITLLHKKLDWKFQHRDTAPYIFGLFVYIATFAVIFFYYFYPTFVLESSVKYHFAYHIVIIVGPLLLALPVAKMDICKSVITNKTTRVYVLSLLLTTPGILLCIGKIQAARILYNIDYEYIETSIDNDLLQANSTTMKYLGVLGSRYCFLSNTDNSTYFIETSKMPRLVVKIFTQNKRLTKY